MRSLVSFCLFLFVLFVTTGCKKNYSGSITGKWNLIRDSSSLVGAPPFFNGGNGVYVGVSGDYYDFRDDGTLYIKENTYLDTATYEMESDHNIKFFYNRLLFLEDSLRNIISKTHNRKVFISKPYNLTNW